MRKKCWLIICCSVMHRIGHQVCSFIIQHSLTFSLSSGLTGRSRIPFNGKTYAEDLPISAAIYNTKQTRSIWHDHCNFYDDKLKQLDYVLTILTALTGFDYILTQLVHQHCPDAASEFARIWPNESDLELLRLGTVRTWAFDINSGQAPEPRVHMAHPYCIHREITRYADG
jgi:hypothetical protein